ncbi:MAG: FAD-dependent oxidoreductase, partial [Treponema sp.]|nr:FAD-dependent oxidoreductase [Treponema sp.]
MFYKIIIGGGYFGLYLSWYLGSKGYKVVLFEKESALMTHASYNNQARIHNGYHYPRSVLTALRSRVSFPRFVKDFPDCV